MALSRAPNLDALDQLPLAYYKETGRHPGAALAPVHQALTGLVDVVKHGTTHQTG